MHIIGVLTSIAILVYWVMRATGSARDSGVIDALQRKRRRDSSTKTLPSELDAIQSSLDAAAVLMVALGRDDITGELSPNMRQFIEDKLTNDLGVEADIASETVVSADGMLNNIVQADTVIRPVCKTLRREIEREDAKVLARVLDDIYAKSANPGADKKQALLSYKDRMGLDI